MWAISRPPTATSEMSASSISSSASSRSTAPRRAVNSCISRLSTRQLSVESRSRTAPATRTVCSTLKPRLRLRRRSKMPSISSRTRAAIALSELARCPIGRRRRAAADCWRTHARRNAGCSPSGEAVVVGEAAEHRAQQPRAVLAALRIAAEPEQMLGGAARRRQLAGALAAACARRSTGACRLDRRLRENPRVLAAAAALARHDLAIRAGDARQPARHQAVVAAAVGEQKHPQHQRRLSRRPSCQTGACDSGRNSSTT